MGAQRAASGWPCCPPFTTALSLGHKAPCYYLVCLRRGVLASFRAPGGCPGASISDLCAIGGGSHSGLGWGWALLVYWRHFCGMSCDVTVLGWCMFGALVGGLLVGACVVVGWIPMLLLQHVLHVLRTHKLSNAVRRLRRSGLAEPHTRPIEAQ